MTVEVKMAVSISCGSVVVVGRTFVRVWVVVHKTL